MKPIVQNEIRDEFLSEEDLDLRNLPTDEVVACWEIWFAQAQATNDADQWTYSHGVFAEVPPCARRTT
jgi:hypothetical protein